MIRRSFFLSIIHFPFVLLAFSVFRSGGDRTPKHGMYQSLISQLTTLAALDAVEATFTALLTEEAAAKRGETNTKASSILRLSLRRGGLLILHLGLALGRTIALRRITTLLGRSVIALLVPLWRILRATLLIVILGRHVGRSSVYTRQLAH